MALPAAERLVLVAYGLAEGGHWGTPAQALAAWRSVEASETEAVRQALAPLVSAMVSGAPAWRMKELARAAAGPLLAARAEADRSSPWWEVAYG